MKSLTIPPVSPHYRSLQRRAAKPLVRGWQEAEGVEPMHQRISSYDHEKIH
jgi:hypothetical protein